MILLHGWSASAEMWQGLMQNLSRDHQVFALDCRGHGRSDKPHDPAQYGIAMVNDVLQLMDTVRVKQAHIIGYSMGGSIVLKMLETHPERFLSAVIGGSTGFRPGQDLWDSTLVKDLAGGMPLSEAMIVNRPSGMPAPSEAQRDMMRQMDAAQDSRALAAQRQGNSGLFITDEPFKTNRVPVLMIYGSLDSPERFVALKAIFANATFVEVSGTGHGSTPDSPAFVAAVRDFLARH
ncbi:MAG TPA: alpha/beta hydrolase [Gemmatimonadales bacterium]|nr:alpha/beta hydrolase [Gemmatimonadales bacterium]